jgi:rod shape-determining protein MreD
MIDPIRTARLGHRLVFLGLVGLLIFVRILPLSAIPPEIPGPDLTLALVLVLVLRRPDHVPEWMIAGVFLLEDLLFMRPPGLWTVIVLLGTEFLRRREATTRDLPFLFEWLMIAIVISAMTFANRLVLLLFMIPQTPLDLDMIRAVITILAYPPVVLFARWVLGLRRAAPGEVDELGHLR